MEIFKQNWNRIGEDSIGWLKKESQCDGKTETRDQVRGPKVSSQGWH